ncbi:MAG: hypothetical protein IPP33_03710 [Flavobacteriales bacterium]|nr:hypothetical protein [Flavobacteriales bacterium]
MAKYLVILELLIIRIRALCAVLSMMPVIRLIAGSADAARGPFHQVVLIGNG